MDPKYEAVREAIMEYVLASHKTGSSYICNPPVLDTDRDHIILVSDLDAVLKICNEAEDVEVSGGYAYNNAEAREVQGRARAQGWLEFLNERAGMVVAPVVPAAAPPDSDFASVRMGQDNLLFTQKQEFYDKFVLATQLSKRFNLLVKQDRIDLFGSVLYGKLKGNER